MRKITLILSFALILTLAVVSVYAASAPAKVKSVKANPTQKSVTLKWKKAKNAKKYQVFMKKGKKLKKVKTTKKKKAVIKKLKPNKTYKFKVRGINGKKAGKYSKVAKVKTLKVDKKTNDKNEKNESKGAFHSTPIKADNFKPSKLKEGDTYVIVSDSGEKEKVTITSKTADKNNYDIFGETPEGGEVILSYNKDTGQESYIMDKDVECKYMDQDWTYDEELLSNTLRFKIKDNDTKVYFTLDGTEPKVGQADLVGKSKMVAFMKSLSEQVPIYYDTPIRGTLKGKGTHLVNTGDNTVNKNRCNWYKVYRNGKLLREAKMKVAE